jgi:predicted dehydrogenase/threonine dehydrogenase-like Zn-dependent dehydrogenase
VKQVLRRGIAEIVVTDVPEPIAPAHHVLIQPAFSLISSGTETAGIHSEGLIKEVAENPGHVRKVLDTMKAAGPIPTAREVRAKFSEYAIMGYSGAGWVVGKHPSVMDLSIGDRVAYGGEGTGHAEVVVTGRKLAARVPDDVTFEQASFATLGSIALNSIRTAAINLGDTVAVVGLGLVGQLVVQLARLQGAVVIAVDLRQDRVDLARSLGAEHAFVADAALPDAVMGVTNGVLADCVIVAAAAKSAGPSQQALNICRDRGRIVIVGAVGLNFPWLEMYKKEIQVFMSRAYGPGSYDADYELRGRDYPLPYVRWTENRNMEEFLRLVARGQVQLDPLVTHTFPLESAPQAYQAIMSADSRSLAVLLKYDEAGPARARSAGPVKHRVELASTVRAGRDTLGVALVGAGNLARWAHLPVLKGIREVRLVGVQSSVGYRGRTYGERFGAAYCTTDFDQILGDPDVDMVVITSRNQHHADQAARCLRAGKHVFVEKPMALTEAECTDLCAAVAESGRELTVGFNRRFAPDYKELKEAIARRAGPVVINCRVNSPGIAGTYWMADPAIGGALLGEACHFVDLMYWLLESEPVRVAAFSLPLDRQHPVGQNNMAAAFHFADGSVGALTYCTVGSKTSGGERVEVFAEGLGASSEDFRRVTVSSAVRRSSRRWFAAKGYADQMQAFCAALRSQTKPTVTVRDGARATVGCLRMLDAARTQAVVAIDLACVGLGSS